MKLLTFTFCCLLAFATHPASAEELNFVTGSQARFTLEQDIVYDDWYPLHSGWHSRITAVMEMKLISPQEVEVVVRDVRADIKNIRPTIKQPRFIYEPNDHADNALANALDSFLNVPMHFTIDQDGKATETTGHLAHQSGILHHFFDADDLELLAISNLHYDLLFRKIFDLKPALKKEAQLKKIQKVDEQFRGTTKDTIIMRLKTSFSKNGFKGYHQEEGSWSRSNALLQEHTVTEESKLHKKGAKVSYMMKLHWKSE